MQNLPALWEAESWPDGRIGAIETERIGIDAIEVNSAESSSRRPASRYLVVVVDEWDDDACITIQLLYLRHVPSLRLLREIGLWDIWPVCVFILGLQYDH